MSEDRVSKVRSRNGALKKEALALKYLKVPIPDEHSLKNKLIKCSCVRCANARKWHHIPSYHDQKEIDYARSQELTNV